MACGYFVSVVRWAC